MKRLLAYMLFAGSFAYPQSATPPPNDEKFDFKARLGWYARRTYTSPSRHAWLIGGVAFDDFALGGIDKWGSGISGFGKSLAPVYGQRIISNTTELFVGQLIGDDARYRPSTAKGFARRGLHAAVSTFTARSQSGRTRPAYSRIIAITGGLLISNRWRPYPKSGYTLSRALVFNVTDMAQDNLLTEFSPELKSFGHKVWKKIRRK